MTKHRTDIVKRVVASLTEDQDRNMALVRYLEDDHDIIVRSVMETLEATRDDVSEDAVVRRVEREILKELRYRPIPGGLSKFICDLWIRRGPVLATVIGTALLLLML